MIDAQRICSAGRLSTQRGLAALAEFSASAEPLTEPSSSASSERVSGSGEEEAIALEGERQAEAETERLEPRSVVVPMQKYSMSLKSMKKPRSQKPVFTALHTRPIAPGISTDRIASDEPGMQSQSPPPVAKDRPYPSIVSELVLPPNMDLSDVMTAHMRYPVQVHRIEAMKPLPKKRTISRGPPMVFGEPVVINPKQSDAPAPTLGPDRRSFVRSASFSHAERSEAEPVVVQRRREMTLDPIITDRDFLPRGNYKAQLRSDARTEAAQVVKRSEPNLAAQERREERSPADDGRSTFPPRFVAVAPPRKASFASEVLNGEDRSGDLSFARPLDSDNGGQVENDRNRQPFTVR